MRPWLHIPVAIFLATLALAVWITLREVPLQRLGETPAFAAALEKLPPPAPQEILKGLLVDALGQPLADADLSTQQDGRVLWTRTDAQGRFELKGLHAGPLQLAVLAPGRLPELIAVEGPGLNARLALKLQPEPYPTIPSLAQSDWVGRVENPVAPKALEGFQIWVVPTGPADDYMSGVPRRTTSEPGGTFRIENLIHAPYRVYVFEPGFEGTLEPNLLVPLGAEAPVHEHGAELNSPEALARTWSLVGGELHGRVYENGRPVRSGLVMLEALEQADSDQERSRVLAPVQSDAQGHWAVSNLPPGRYRVRIRGGGLHLEQEVALPPSTRLEVKF